MPFVHREQKDISSEYQHQKATTLCEMENASKGIELWIHQKGAVRIHLHRIEYRLYNSEGKYWTAFLPVLPEVASFKFCDQCMGALVGGVMHQSGHSKETKEEQVFETRFRAHMC